MDDVKEEDKMEMLNQFWELLLQQGYADLHQYIDVCCTEFWEDMSADQIWVEQAEAMGSGFSYPSEFAFFRDTRPDWHYAKSALGVYF